MTDSTRSSIILGLAFLGILLMNGLFFMMPYEALNPYEYLSGSNLSTFQVLDIFIGGAIVPLVALATGYLINAFRHYGIGNLAKVAAFVLALGIVQTFFIFAFDFLPGLVLMALVALFFLKAHWAVSLLAALLLFFFHLTANVLVGFFASVGSPTDIIYTAMQDVQEFTSVFRSTDYFAIIALNIELFSRNVISTLYGLLFTVLPWLLVGMSLGRLDIVRFIRSNPVMHIILFIVLAGGGMAIKMIQVLTLGSYSGRPVGGELRRAGARPRLFPADDVPHHHRAVFRIGSVQADGQIFPDALHPVECRLHDDLLRHRRGNVWGNGDCSHDLDRPHHSGFPDGPCNRDAPLPYQKHRGFIYA